MKTKLQKCPKCGEMAIDHVKDEIYTFFYCNTCDFKQVKYMANIYERKEGEE